jgi:hypothetical protein
VIEQRALAEVGALAACGALQPAADQLGALDQGIDLRELALGHRAEPVDR